MAPKDKNLQAITENAEQLARELEAARRERDEAKLALAKLTQERKDICEVLKLCIYDWRVGEIDPAISYIIAEIKGLQSEAERLVKERDHAKKELAEAKRTNERMAGIVGTSLVRVGKRAHENCFKRGFHKPGAMRSYLKRTTHAIEELNEALLAIEREKSSYFEVGGKPEGVLAEFADAIIIISEMAHHYLASCDPGLKMQGVSLDSAVAAKLEYNDRREDGVNGNSV